MKRVLFCIAFILLSVIGYAQETHTVKGEQIVMETEVEGTINLYVNKENGEYRYFVAKNNVFYELTNTKDANGQYAYEYRNVLLELTADNPTKVKINKTRLDLGGLREVVVAYNKQQDTSYTYTNKHYKIGVNLGFMGGVTNNVFADNPENVSVPQFLIEAEFFNAVKPKWGHSLFVHLKHSLDDDDFKYASTQLSFNYRYKFINADGFKLYAQAKMVTLSYIDQTIYYVDANGQQGSYEDNGVSFKMPMLFGVGTDVKIAKGTYLTLQYNDVVALFMESNGEFPVDLNFGVKFTL